MGTEYGCNPTPSIPSALKASGTTSGKFSDSLMIFGKPCLPDILWEKTRFKDKGGHEISGVEQSVTHRIRVKFDLLRIKLSRGF